VVRQLYFLGRNIYEIYYQPYLTIKEIVGKKDKSQIVLIIIASLTPAMMYLLARIGWDLWKYQRILMLTGNAFLIMGIIQVIVLAFLTYWTIKVLKEKK